MNIEMKRNLIITFFILTIPIVTFSQKFFSLADTNFEVGQIYRTDFTFGLSYPIIFNSYPKLDSIIDFLTRNPTISVEIGVNTDFRGNDIFNDTLSTFRAESIYRHLVSRSIDKNRITFKGYGERNPVIVTSDLHEKYPFLTIGQILTETYIKSLQNIEYQEIANEINRRVELKIIKTWL